MDKAKEIIAKFLKLDPSEIDNNTKMDNQTIPGSILIHRMYALLSAEGYTPKNSNAISTYGEFVIAVGQKSDPSDATASPSFLKKEKILNTSSDHVSSMQVGIDIEDVLNMPEAPDYRRDKFYTENFSPREISYCILQVDPRVSFAGRFSLKEAIIKADNSYKNVAFKDIEITNDVSGKPTFAGFLLSISHTPTQSAAVAIKVAIPVPTQNQTSNAKKAAKKEIEEMIKKAILDTKNNNRNNWMNIVSIILSLLAMSIIIFQMVFRDN